MNIKRWLKSRSDFWDIYLVLAIAFAFIVCLSISHRGCGFGPLGCASMEASRPPPDITRAISCPVADDITCQKCHDWKKIITDWHNPETNKLGKVEIILPEIVEIDFESGHTYIINADLPSGDWICENIFYQFDDSVEIQILYNRWSISSHPPIPPIALHIETYISLDSEIPIESHYWIYRNGVPKEVDQNEFELFILSLKSGVGI